MESQVQKVTSTADCDLAIVGAGPVGLTIANIVGAAGLKVILIEQLDELINYPRGVGLDDEALRVFQSIGLVDRIVKHTTPFHWVRIYNDKRQLITTVEPRHMPYGWSKRNAFHQPLADKVLYEGLARYPNVRVLFGHQMTEIEDGRDSVTIRGQTTEGGAFSISSRYLVGSDGGRSFTRKHIGAAFEGNTKPEPFLVIDLADDPIGRPNLEFVCDARLPYVSIALPHGVRRFEFSVPKEAVVNGNDVTDDFVAMNLSRIKPGISIKSIIRRRVYYHSARLASKFRSGRVLIAGDAARLMPVWQGQGYNSGIRDAINVGWKLVFVLKGRAEDALLDSYHQERWQNSKDMIAVSVLMGRIFNPGPKILCMLRDWFFWTLDIFPNAKRYVTTMAWKPVPKITRGVIVEAPTERKNNPVGTLFFQPWVRDKAGARARLDDFIGVNFAVVSWSNDPSCYLDDEAKAILDKLSAIKLVIRPVCQAVDGGDAGEFSVLYDDGEVKDWFDLRRGSIVIVRPDKVVAAICEASDISETLRKLGRKMFLR